MSTADMEALTPSREDWRPRLSSLRQYQYESNLAKPTEGHLLVDDELHSRDWRLWLELLQFKQRHYGQEGVKLIFEQMIQRDLELCTDGHEAQALWHRFIQAGAEDTALLEQVVRYASRLLNGTGKSWPRLYVTVMTLIMTHSLPTIMYWHTRLKQDFPPTFEDYQKLFHISMDSGSTEDFAQVYEDYPVRPMYASIVPKLCNARMYEQAFSWHFTLLGAKDLPMEFLAIEPLLFHYAQLRDDRSVEAVVTSVLENSTKIKAPLRKFVSDSKVISRKIMYRQLGEIHGIAPKEFTDQFCARLFATKIFSVDTIINGLDIMGLQSIGHESLREIVSRDDCECSAICRHLDRLREAGIMLNTSKYSTIVRQAAQDNRRWLLRSIVECDAHPDTFEDINLQEELLTMYLDRGDNVQMERTLAILTTDVTRDTLEMQRFNFILRGHIRLCNKDKVISMLEKMKALSIPLTPRSSRHFRVHWLSRRRVGKTGCIHLTLRDLALIINVMKQTLETGAAIPPEAWREILRRLGMTGQLMEFRSLALWLADWYASMPPATNSVIALQRSFHRIIEHKKRGITAPEPSQQHTSVVSASSIPGSAPGLRSGLTFEPAIPTWSNNTKSRRQGNPLNQLFTKSSQQAMIAWAFQEEAKRPPSSLTDSYRRQSHPNWAWGLLLLRQLRERGVQINKQVVAKACRLRLMQLFGTGVQSKRAVNRTARRLNDMRRRAGEPEAQYGTYIRAMESIWGQDLFTKFPSRRNMEIHGQGPGRRKRWRIMITEAKK
ncbi:MAG: hypothetical protein Q9163_000461 [Psora crenata]